MGAHHSHRNGCVHAVGYGSVLECQLIGATSAGAGVKCVLGARRLSGLPVKHSLDDVDRTREGSQHGQLKAVWSGRIECCGDIGFVRVTHAVHKEVVLPVGPLAWAFVDVRQVYFVVAERVDDRCKRAGLVRGGEQDRCFVVAGRA